MNLKCNQSALTTKQPDPYYQSSPIALPVSHKHKLSFVWDLNMSKVVVSFHIFPFIYSLQEKALIIMTSNTTHKNIISLTTRSAVPIALWGEYGFTTWSYMRIKVCIKVEHSWESYPSQDSPHLFQCAEEAWCLWFRCFQLMFSCQYPDELCPHYT